MFDEIIHPLRIGDVQLTNNLVLGPMAGVSDLPFRLLCHEQGAGLVCGEMVSAKAIIYHNKRTYELLEVDPGEHPVAMQLFGSDPEIVSAAAQEIESQPWDILDINMGCPVPKVFNNGEGSALTKDPTHAAGIVEKTVKAIHKPVTVKIRIGVDAGHVNAVEMAKAMEAAGAAAIAVHGRTREEYYSGHAHWDVIAAVKQAVKIPVIGNGDIRTPEDVTQMYEETGVDGFMIARAAKGNPWIFRDILTYFKTGEKLSKPSPEEMVSMLLRQAELACQHKGEYIAIREMRKHAAWYTAGYRNASQFRGRINEIETLEDLRNLLHGAVQDD